MTYFQSRRSTVIARNGMVATSQPMAAQAGLRMLQEGGNAMDAAVAAAAVLGVVEPMHTGLGGDMFALIWMNRDRKVLAFNGSGRAAAAADPEEVRRKGHTVMPRTGPDAAYAVTVPGSVDGWQTCLEACGRMTLKETLKPAIGYARDGFGVSELVAYLWEQWAKSLDAWPEGRDELLLNGRPPHAGELMRIPTLASTMEAIAEGGKDAFYRGPLAERICDFVQRGGGWLTERDLADHHSDWDEPISTTYRGMEIYECPPNTHGVAALEALNIAEGFDIAAMGPQSVDRYHHLIEAMRLAYADAFRYVADPRVAEVPTNELISKEYAGHRRALISSHYAIPKVSYGNSTGGADTVYITVIDGEGNAVSFINSVYMKMAGGMVVPGAGFLLQNRGALFSLDPDSPNYLTPRKRPYHTIIPAMAIQNGEVRYCFGVMGGYQQPQGHLQVMSNIVDFGMEPQQALDALRFSIDPPSDTVRVEDGLPHATVEELRRRGHKVEVFEGHQHHLMGGGQLIERDPETGLLKGASEPRLDGLAAGW